jgi:hypothetical protein
MEKQIQQEFTRCSYEMTSAERTFDTMVVGSISSTTITFVLLIVHFYQVSFVLTGLLPYVIQLGLLLMPIFGLGTLLSYQWWSSAKREHEVARLTLIRSLQTLRENDRPL